MRWLSILRSMHSAGGRLKRSIEREYKHLDKEKKLASKKNKAVDRTQRDFSQPPPVGRGVRKKNTTHLSVHDASTDDPLNLLQLYKEIYKNMGRYARANLIYGFLFLQDNFKDTLSWFKDSAAMPPEDKDDPRLRGADYMANLLNSNNLHMIIDDFVKRASDGIQKSEEEWYSRIEKAGLDAMPPDLRNTDMTALKSDLHENMKGLLEPRNLFDYTIGNYQCRAERLQNKVDKIQRDTEKMESSFFSFGGSSWKDIAEGQSIRGELLNLIHSELVPQWENYLNHVVQAGNGMFNRIYGRAEKRYASDMKYSLGSITASKRELYLGELKELHKDLLQGLEQKEEELPIKVREMISIVEETYPLPSR